jgi:small-conductance mechanosensitive channel
MRSLTPLVLLGAGTLVLSPLLTRADPVVVGLAAWLSVAFGLAIATRSALLLVDNIAARLRSRSLRSTTMWDDLLTELGGQVARTVIMFCALYVGTIILVVPEGAQHVVDTFLGLAIIGLFAWMLVALVGIGDRFLQHRFRIDVPDNLQARRVYTQLVVMRRLAYLVIGILAVSLALMQFESIRRIGTSILASAGLAGIIIGFAAQRTLANLLAGIQIALSQPLRIDDAVSMEGEFGRVEEVTLTYVVIALWDERRLIIPLSRVIENPFQNWTRTGSRLLGTVTTRCDFRVPVEAMRAEAKRVVESDSRWDKRVFAVHVTDWAEGSVEVRILVSANDSGSLFDLRCAVREAMLLWLQEKNPTALPRMRLESSRQTTAT